MRQYELMVIFPLEEGPQKIGRDQLQADLAANGIEIEKNSEIGERDLAYEINKHKRGKYVLYNLKMDSAKIVNLDKVFKLNVNLIRYLFVKIT
jgi:small subunit ribosomal protein S6